MGGVGTGGTGGERVLLCATDEGARDSLARALAAAGFEVEAAVGAADALDRLRRDGRGTVVLAVSAGGASAGEFTRAATGIRPEATVIVLAAPGEIEAAVDAVRHGARDFLRPPFAADDVVAAVRRAVALRDPRSPGREALREMLKSQYRSALAMLRSCVERCPDALWDDPRHTNRTWQIAYHAIYFARYYGGRDEGFDDFWEGHVRETRNPDGIGGPPEPGEALPNVPPAYTRADVLAACDHCMAGVDAAVDALDLDAPRCGFPWYPMPRLEHQFVNLRHIQHHAGQLAERLRAEAGIGTPWVGLRRR